MNKIAYAIIGGVTFFSGIFLLGILIFRQPFVGLKDISIEALVKNGGELWFWFSVILIFIGIFMFVMTAFAGGNNNGSGD